MESVVRVDIVDPAVHNPEAPDELVRICADVLFEEGAICRQGHMTRPSDMDRFNGTKYEAS